MRLVLVIGAQPLIDSLLRQRGMQPAWVGGYRVTNQATLKAAVEAAGQARIMSEQFLSKVRGRACAHACMCAWLGPGWWSESSGRVLCVSGGTFLCSTAHPTERLWAASIVLHTPFPPSLAGPCHSHDSSAHKVVLPDPLLPFAGRAMPSP